MPRIARRQLMIETVGHIGIGIAYKIPMP